MAYITNSIYQHAPMPEAYITQGANKDREIIIVDDFDPAYVVSGGINETYINYVAGFEYTTNNIKIRRDLANFQALKSSAEYPRSGASFVYIDETKNYENITGNSGWSIQKALEELDNSIGTGGSGAGLKYLKDGPTAGSLYAYDGVAGSQLSGSSTNQINLGDDNSIISSSDNSTIAGGITNKIETVSDNSFIGSGDANTITDASLNSFIGSGNLNTIETSDYSGILSGKSNYINSSSNYSSVFGGENNEIQSGTHSTIPGGLSNTVSGNYSLAFGRRAKVTVDGSISLTDSIDADFTNSTANSFRSRFDGGYYLQSDSGDLIINSQNVGIGEDTPGAKLEVNGDFLVTDFLWVQGDVGSNSTLVSVPGGSIDTEDTATLQISPCTDPSEAEGTNGPDIVMRGPDAGVEPGIIRIKGRQTGIDIVTQSAVGGPIEIRSRAGTGIYVDTSNQVGIGTDSPGALLDVNGDSIFNSGKGAFDTTIHGDAVDDILNVNGSADRLIHFKNSTGSSTPTLTGEGNPVKLPPAFTETTSTTPVELSPIATDDHKVYMVKVFVLSHQLSSSRCWEIARVFDRDDTTVGLEAPFAKTEIFDSGGISHGEVDLVVSGNNISVEITPDGTTETYWEVQVEYRTLDNFEHDGGG